ncbi:MAG: tetratricopeptide repeat protein, partial [Myxococcota bacterium]
MIRPTLMVALLALGVGCGKKAPPASAVDSAPTEQGPGFDPNAPLPDKVALAIAKLESGAPEDIDLAIAILEQSLPEDPGGATQLNLGIALQTKGELAAAVPHYEAVIAAHPEWPETWVYLGSVKERLGDVEGAMRTYRDAIEVDTENMGARVGLIAALRSQGKPDEAIEQAKQALKVNANSLPVYNNFALAYLDKGDTTLARFILQKALQGIEGAQTNAYLHTNLGWSHYLDGNKPAAVQSLDKAVTLEPGLVPALVYLATVYLEDRNYADMIPLLETALENDPVNADVYLNLGIAFRGMQRFDDAK